MNFERLPPDPEVGGSAEKGVSVGLKERLLPPKVGRSSVGSLPWKKEHC